MPVSDLMILAWLLPAGPALGNFPLWMAVWGQGIQLKTLNLEKRFFEDDTLQFEHEWHIQVPNRREIASFQAMVVMVARLLTTMLVDVRHQHINTGMLVASDFHHQIERFRLEYLSPVSTPFTETLL